MSSDMEPTGPGSSSRRDDRDPCPSTPSPPISNGSLSPPSGSGRPFDKEMWREQTPTWRLALKYIIQNLMKFIPNVILIIHTNFDL